MSMYASPLLIGTRGLKSLSKESLEYFDAILKVSQVEQPSSTSPVLRKKQIIGFHYYFYRQI